MVFSFLELAVSFRANRSTAPPNTARLTGSHHQRGAGTALEKRGDRRRQIAGGRFWSWAAIGKAAISAIWSNGNGRAPTRSGLLLIMDG
jgi:hypothetical protein